MQPGQHVTIRRLASRADLNGCHGIVRSFNAASGRYGVEIDGAKILALKRKNLTHFEAPPEELTDPDKIVEANARLCLGSVMVGDRVVSQSGREGTLLAVADRVATVKVGRQRRKDDDDDEEEEEEEEEEECLLRDCTMLFPTGRARAAPAVVRQSFELASWAEKMAANASGHWSAGHGRRGHTGLEREGVHWLLPVGTSEPVPPCVRVASVTLEVGDGMDQGWGNSGDSGVLLSLRRAGRQEGDGEGDGEARALHGHDEREAVLEIVYDRGRSRSRQHRATVELASGPFAPRGGDRFEAWLRCPNYPGWSAHCQEVLHGRRTPDLLATLLHLYLLTSRV